MSTNIEEFVFENLRGRFRHYCHEWDGLAIDETCSEFGYCTCDFGELSVMAESVKKEVYRQYTFKPKAQP